MKVGVEGWLVKRMKEIKGKECYERIRESGF